MKRRLVYVSLLVALMSSAFVPSVSASSSMEAQFASLINKERKERSIHTLVTKGNLVAMARKHSERMADDGTIYHNKNLSKEVPGKWTACGENVGMGPSVEGLHDAFMASPGHRANILDRDYDEVGVGVVVRDDVIYVTVVFVGRPSAPKPAPKAVTVAKQAPKPAPPRPVVIRVPARTMDMLLALAGLDARRIDPTNGQALGL